MTPEWRELAQSRSARARETLAEARALLERGSAAGAVNRAYYAAFYAARALLATSALDSSKHSGVLAIFDRHFVLAGLIAREHGRALHDLFTERTRADYADQPGFDLESAAKLVKLADALVQAAATLLEKRLSGG